ncbi:MAG: IS630 family transposase [Meiothermus sp.]|nr:IS630 family transposase [Meiothermus sp.]
MEKKAEDGEITLKYLDEAGFSLSLPLSYTWSPKNHPLRVPKHWGNAGRINVIGSLSCHKDTQVLEYQILEGRCTSEQVEIYLESLAQQTQQQQIPVTVVLDNAGFHKAKRIKKQLARWQQMGLTLWFQPPYSPHFNRIETVWKRLKGFLLPRRYYNSRLQLLNALNDALNLLGAVEISHS